REQGFAKRVATLGNGLQQREFLSWAAGAIGASTEWGFEDVTFTAVSPSDDFFCNEPGGVIVSACLLWLPVLPHRILGRESFWAWWRRALLRWSRQLERRASS